MRHRGILWLALALLAACISSAGAEEFPARPIRLIIGFPPGSAADIPARIVGETMSKTLGQPIVVESKLGAGSSVAAEYVARSPADGYTLFLGASSNVTDAALNSGNLHFDFAKDFAPITTIADLPLILAVHPSLKVSNVKDLIALAKSKPGELSYGSVGYGTVAHLATELFAQRTGIKLIHVPYQGSPPALTDLMAGRVVMMLTVASTIMPQVRAGRLIGLASSSAKRPSVAPDLPTIAEAAGLPDYDITVWWGLMAPTGTPRAIIDKLAAAANDALKSEAVIARLKAQGFDPMGGTPEDFAQLIAHDSSNWKAAVQAAGMKK